MSRRDRRDEPGALHHVMNRGIARRTMFERAEDVRYLLSLYAWEVQRGRIRVHCYSVVSTHFHFTVESLLGTLSATMRWVESMYVRRFNRTRRRDGPLVRARFTSKRIESESYRRALVAYIDRNASEAGLARHGAAYAHGSAAHYLRQSGPPWLERSWIEADVCRRLGLPRYDPSRYPEAFGRGATKAQIRWMEARIASGAVGPDPLDDLLADAPDAVLSWMKRKAELADGTDVGLPLVDAESVLAVVGEHDAAVGSWSVRAVRRSHSGWDMNRVGLLRDLCGLAYAEIAARAGCSSTTARLLCAHHRQELLASAEYAARSGDLCRAALRRCHRP